jgi:hypothetical protein
VLPNLFIYALADGAKLFAGTFNNLFVNGEGNIH